MPACCSKDQWRTYHGSWKRHTPALLATPTQLAQLKAAGAVSRGAFRANLISLSALHRACAAKQHMAFLREQLEALWRSQEPQAAAARGDPAAAEHGTRLESPATISADAATADGTRGGCALSATLPTLHAERSGDQAPTVASAVPAVR